ncbi:sulfurtransferase TusA family protein [Aerophototrophica crusticola]|uniref:Sulfurtransferase TusA family protein n=1 Tax=Aerophototrophica crusticola TaxID=1709002 RepID=A0A858R8G7_9PROT|nr:sulfurtransferase TusA family protein [Rhodospirillaceae bacterium B3]
MSDTDVLLDCSGLICPLPVLRARKRLKDLADGQVLRVLATDKAAPRDFETFCREAGHGLLENAGADGVYSFRIRKGG